MDRVATMMKCGAGQVEGFVRSGWRKLADDCKDRWRGGEAGEGEKNRWGDRTWRDFSSRSMGRYCTAGVTKTPPPSSITHRPESRSSSSGRKSSCCILVKKNLHLQCWLPRLWYIRTCFINLPSEIKHPAVKTHRVPQQKWTDHNRIPHNPPTSSTSSCRRFLLIFFGFCFRLVHFTDFFNPSFQDHAGLGLCLAEDESKAGLVVSSLVQDGTAKKVWHHLGRNTFNVFLSP